MPSCQCVKFGGHLRRRGSFPLERFFFSQFTLHPKKDHQERVIREGPANICCDPIWAHDGVYSDFVCSFVKSGSFTFLFDSKRQSGLLCVYKKNLSLRLILDARRLNQHFKVPPKFPAATGDAISRVDLLIGISDESAALHIASGDVQNAFHHMGIPEWLRPHFHLGALTARAFGMTGKIVQGSRVSAEQQMFLALLTLPMGFSWSISFCKHVGLHQANCADL